MKYSSLDATPNLPTEYLLGEEPLAIPRGDITVCFGEGASGKGRLTAALIKQVTADGGTVVGAWPEDHPCEQLRPRLEAAGLTADEMSRVVNITRLPGAERFKLSADLTHPGHVPLLRTEILPALKADGHDVRMLVLDPLAALIGWGSIQSNAGARRALEPVQDLCQDTGIACWLVAHTTKAGQLQGSAGLLQAVRLAYRLTKDGDQRVLTAEKRNNLPEMEPVRFEIVSTEDGNARVQFLTAADLQERQAAWRTQQTPTRTPSLRNQLRNQLRPQAVHAQAPATTTPAPATQVPPSYTTWLITQKGEVVEKETIKRTPKLERALEACTTHPKYGKARGWSNHVQADKTVNHNSLISQITDNDGERTAFMIVGNRAMSVDMLTEVMAREGYRSDVMARKEGI